MTVVPRTTIHFVPHTHWDREWYEPFQVFRMRLVELVDNVLERLEHEPAFRFTLDGQLATIDDYLEIRPEEEQRIRRFVGEGRLAIGPWQILMDEFLVSGETIVRNLQHGWRRAHDFGRPMAVGYLPDMFGHIAQMPQILRGAGIDQAVVWRGVPAAVTENSFRWRSPDGSEVAAEYLVGGYGNAAYLLEVPGNADAKVRGYRALMGSWYGDTSLLAMYGTDHMAPPPEMIALLEGINIGQADVAIRIETLAEYMAQQGRSGSAPVRADPGRTLIEGELRSGARANMLMGVTSSHIDIKQAAARAERWLSRYAEPLSALHAADWPERMLDLAWARVIECSAHDSICGCSVDEVAAQVLVRLGEAEQIGRELTARAALGVAQEVALGDWLWLNPSPVMRTDVVELDVLAADDAPSVALQLADGQLVATQEIDRNEPLLFEAEMMAPEVGVFLARRMHGRELFGRRLNDARLEDGRVTLWLDQVANPEWLDVDQLRHDIEAFVMAKPDQPWHLRVMSAARRRVRAMVSGPALGWAAAHPVPGTGIVDHPVTASNDALDNGLVAVRVAADGTLTVARDGIEIGLIGRLVDGGDAGDSYNYGPPASDTVMDTPTEVRVSRRASGPIVGELLVRRTYRLPIALSSDHRSRSSETVATTIDMIVELRADEPFVRVAFEFDNQANDHRLRLHVPVGRQSDHSSAEGQYAVVERGLAVEAGHGEVPLPTFPAYGWVDAGGVAVLLDHVVEYELLGGHELALTLLRSIGMISRNDNPYREDPAGPERPMPAAQMRGRQRVTCGILVHSGEWPAAGVPAMAERYAQPFVVAEGRRRGPATAAAPGGAQGLAVEGNGVVLTALQRRDDWLELRLACESPVATTALIGPSVAAWRDVDLLGRAGAQVDGSGGVLSLTLQPWQIRTIQIRR